MLDIVSAENLPKADGIDAQVSASALKNFIVAPNEAAARAGSKRNGALLYVPSYEFDDGVLVELARNGGAILFAFSDVLHERGFRRGILLSKMRLALAAARKRKCGVVACTLAKSEQELRNARELKSFMAVIGFVDVERKNAEELLEKLVSK